MCPRTRSSYPGLGPGCPPTPGPERVVGLKPALFPEAWRRKLIQPLGAWYLLRTADQDASGRLNKARLLRTLQDLCWSQASAYRLISHGIGTFWQEDATHPHGTHGPGRKTLVLVGAKALALMSPALHPSRARSRWTWLARNPSERFRMLRNRALLLVLWDTPTRRAELAQDVDRADVGRLLYPGPLKSPLKYLVDPSLGHREYPALPGDLPLVAELVQPGHQGRGQRRPAVFRPLCRSPGRCSLRRCREGRLGLTGALRIPGAPRPNNVMISRGSRSWAMTFRAASPAASASCFTSSMPM